jgi:hypothetical protein
MNLEPFSVPAPLGTVLAHNMPELLGVVHLLHMGKLMDNNIVYDWLRHHKELPVEVEITFLGAAAPACLGSPDGQPIIPDAQLAR